MFDKVVEKIEKTYSRNVYTSIVLILFVLVFFIISFCTKLFSAPFTAFNPNVALQFESGFSNIFNIIIFVIILIFSIASYIGSKKRNKKGLVFGTIVGFVFFAFSAIALSVIGRKSEVGALNLAFWIILIILGLVFMCLFGLFGFIKIDILKQRAKPKDIKNNERVTKTTKVAEKKEYYENYDVQESYSESSSTNSSTDYSESHESHEYRY